MAVELKEWAVTPASLTATAGAIEFAVRNTGSTVHEFVVVKTDLKAADLPVSGNKIDETALTPIDEIEDIAVGATPTLKVTLEPGHYVLLCNIEAHFGLGMRSDFDVN
ncbi:MAG TPA: cupredoxin domain-containing protein [Candidatus Limnocylindrales bacterium]|nr:cupredoxin domain-containing protein [Candidatus Limnocylindrales bacterium]